ncbi:hypothetical protein QN219_24965 [Sinorhizobium sp. 7-81]|uniref:hypothetical protein n=1 Tax=Sinorhizobium sp. 8-89 TaxID=3049089 RepID=UPI0024C2B2AE|nr:hypothetical protein [Sinorhizobium sp. 8-89]MDK1493259.1 hypothetical protein [Sinorhizobium sp. 8-89]
MGRWDPAFIADAGPVERHEVGDEWRDPLGLRGCGFFTVRDRRIAFQGDDWGKLSSGRLHPESQA